MTQDPSARVCAKSGDLSFGAQDGRGAVTFVCEVVSFHYRRGSAPVGQRMENGSLSSWGVWEVQSGPPKGAGETPFTSQMSSERKLGEAAAGPMQRSGSVTGDSPGACTV